MISHFLHSFVSSYLESLTLLCHVDLINTYKLHPRLLVRGWLVPIVCLLCEDLLFLNA